MTALTQLHQDWETLRQSISTPVALPTLTPVALSITTQSFSTPEALLEWVKHDASLKQGITGGWVQGVSSIEYSTDGLPDLPEPDYLLSGEWCSESRSVQLAYRQQHWRVTTLIEDSDQKQKDYLVEDRQQRGRRHNTKLVLHYRRYWQVIDQRPRLVYARLCKIEN